MGVKMPRLNNFTLNSNFPAVAKANSSSASLSMSAQTLGVGGNYSVTRQISVGQGDILSPIIELGGTYYPTTLYANTDGTWQELVIIERTSPTVATMIMYIENIGSATATHPAWTANAYLESFRIP